MTSLSLAAVSKTIFTDRVNYMKRKFIITAVVALAMSSCGYEISIQSTETSTTTSTTTIPPTTTTTTIYLGADCHPSIETEWIELRKVLSEARIHASGVPTTKEYNAEVGAWRNLRTFIRSLDIPTLTVEQNAYVDAIQDYLVAYNQYIDSGKTDLSVNNYRIPMSDAANDFVDAWNEVCHYRDGHQHDEEKAGA